MLIILKKKKNNIEGGFTLIEMLVTVFVFSLVFGSASALFVSAVRSQSRALASQQISNETSYLIEYTGRAIRMAKKELGNPVLCLPFLGFNYATTSSRTLGGQLYSGLGIKFINYKDECQEFFLDDNTHQLMESKDGGIPSALTSSNLYVEKFNLSLSGESQEDYLQPRVTMFLEIRKAGQGSQPKIKIQTTISQRRLDILEPD